MPRLFPLLAAIVLVAGCGAAAHAQPSDSPTFFLLVRHAEKAAEPGADPSISPAGQARAEALRVALADAGVEHVVASQFARTAQTARPLADALGLPVETRPLDSGDAAASARTEALALVEDYRGKTVLVVGHSNTIPAMVGALLGTDMAELDERDYDNLFLVVLPEEGTPRLIRARFGAADDVP